MYLRFMKNNIFMWYHRKIENNSIGFFQARNCYNKMTFVKKSYISKSGIK